MIKQSVCFGCLLFLVAAIAAVSAQEDAAAINDSIMSEEVALNNTTMNATSNESMTMPPVQPSMEAAAEEVANATTTSPANESTNESTAAESLTAMPAENDTVPAEEEIIPAENMTEPESIAPAAVSDNATEMAPAIALGLSNEIATSEKPVYAIGGGKEMLDFFPIGAKNLTQEAYEVGLPAETVMDLSALPFFLNKI